MKNDPRDYIDAVPFPEHLSITPIGRIHSPFRERFGTPRQPHFKSPQEAGTVDGRIEIFDTIAPEALRDLNSFDAIWILSWFHLNGPRLRPMVRPPRGGPKRGVFSTRAPHRPNPIGLSAVELLSVEGRILHIRGVDLLDNTPVLDIKPYISDYDALPNASRGWLEQS